MNRLVVTSPIPPELAQVLARGNELVPMQDGVMPGFDIAVTTSVGGADAALFDRLPDLRLLLCNGTGLENIDLGAARQRGIIVRNTPDEVTDDTADFAIGLTFAVLRRIAEADRFMRAGRWGPERMSPSRRVFDRRMGIVGLGKIGKTIARRASGLGMTVLYTGPRPKQGEALEYRPSLHDLAAEVDVLVLSCPGGPGTHHIVDAAVLERLGKEGVLINVSRGSVVKEDDLIAALEAGTIAGAGLDVFAAEPAFDERLAGFDNVVLAPHYAAVTRETRLGIATTLAGAAEDFRAGRPVPDAAAAGQGG